MLPNDLVTALENLVGSADDEGCEGLVVVGKHEFFQLLKASNHAGIGLKTHIDEEDVEEVE